MSKIRNKLIATLAIFAMLFTSLSAVMFAGSNFAKAEGDGSAVVGVFQLQDGASAGYLGEAEDGKDYAGLRWKTIINKAYYASLVGDLEFGTIIAPKSYGDLDFSKITKDGNDWYTSDGDYVSVIPSGDISTKMKSIGDDLSGEYVMYSAIRYDELDENLIAQAKTELVAKAYVKITNGETVTYNYSEADTVRSLRNSVAYNLAAGNFSEADAASLKKFAVAEDKTYAKLDGEVLYSVNNPELRETTVNFGDKLAGKNAEFALNSKYFDANYDLEKGVVTLGDNFFADLEQGVYYLTAFCDDGNVYYTEVLKATTISTANDLLMFRLVDSESAGVNSNANTNPDTIDKLKTFDGYYVLTNNIDASTMSERLYSWAHNTVNNEAENSSVMLTKGLTGTFDGRGYAISNLKVYRGGLFGIINGTVKNVAFQNINHCTYGSRLFANSAFLANRMTSIGVMENVAVFAPTDTVKTGIISKFTVGATFTNCYFESPYSYALSPRSSSGYPKGDTNYFGNSSNLVIVSPFVLDGANADNCFDMIDVTDGNGYLGNTSTVVTPQTRSANDTLKRYQSAEDLSNRYALGDNDTLANENGVKTTKTVIDSFENRSSFTVIDGKIYWASFSQVKLNGELLNVSELELAVGESAEITVFNVVGESTPDFKIISSSDAVSISNGIITAVKPGEPTLSVISKGVVLAKLTVNVYKIVVDKTADTIIVDANGEAFTLPGKYSADNISVDVDGVTASIVNGKLFLDGAKVTTDSNGAVTPTEYIVTFETADKIYNYKVKYITAYIKTADEFVSTFALANGNGSAASYEELALFDGYYMLGDNLDFTNVSFAEQLTVKTFGKHALDSDPKTNVNFGLTGTFDGDGYTLSNFVAPDGGLFGVVTGTIKNVAFINADVASGQNGIIAYVIYGSAKINNIYLTYNGDYSSAKHLLARYSSINTTITNSYFEGDLVQIGQSFYSQTDSYAAGPQNANSFYILVSKRMITSQSKWESRIIDGAEAGSTKYNPWTSTSNTTAVHARAKGKIYRYETVKEMMDVYNNGVYTYDGVEQDMSTQKGNLETLFNDWDKTYFNFDTTNGLTWRTKTAE